MSTGIVGNVRDPDLLVMLYFSAAEHFVGVGINHLCHYLKVSLFN